MNEYNVSENNITDDVKPVENSETAKSAETTEAAEVTETVEVAKTVKITETAETIKSAEASRIIDKSMNLADLVEPKEHIDQMTDSAKPHLFDNLTLFLIMMAIGIIVSITVCHIFNNWYLGFMLGSYLGTALGLVALSIRKLCSK